MAVNYSIRELRGAAEELTNIMDIPFIEWSQSFLKRRLFYATEKLGIRKHEQLLEAINNDEQKDEFSRYMTVPVTEMFRDARLWRTLRQHFNETSYNDTINVWIPDVSTGEELYTLLILAKENGLFDKMNIWINHNSKSILKDIENGIVGTRKLDTNSFNYKRFEGTASFDNYISEIEGEFQLSKDLLKNVNFTHGYFLNTAPQEKMDLVLFRNVMLYFKKDFHTTLKDYVDQKLKPGGLLCVGVKEVLPSPFSSRFECIDVKEKIYQKFKVLTD